MKKINRLLKNNDFKKVIKEKKYFSNKSFTMYYSSNSLDHLRIGISINKKYGKAFKRNLAKRQVRMMCEQLIPIDFKYDFVLIIRNEFSELNYEENFTNLKFLFKKITDEVNK